MKIEIKPKGSNKDKNVCLQGAKVIHEKIKD